MNHLHRELKMYFPEYKDAFGNNLGTFMLTILMKVPMPDEIVKLGREGIKQIWHDAKLRGRGYSRVEKIISYAQNSVGLKEGCQAARTVVIYHVEDLLRLKTKLDELDNELQEKVLEIPSAEKVLEIPGLGNKIVSGILAQIGDISRFDDVKGDLETQWIRACSRKLGKHNGMTKISRRGQGRPRYWLIRGDLLAVAHSPEFKALHQYYTTRPVKLKKMHDIKRSKLQIAA